MLNVKRWWIAVYVKAQVCKKHLKFVELVMEKVLLLVLGVREKHLQTKIIYA
jgi:hypothetical protein